MEFDHESRSAKCSVSKAIGRMIVDHARGLHERVANNRADEFESPTFQILAYGVGDRRVTGEVVRRLPAILDRSAVDESPDILVKASDFLLDDKKGPCVCNDRLNFEPIPDNAGIVQQALDFSCVVPGD